MNKMVKAVEEYIDETELVHEEWSDATKILVNAGVSVVVARDVAYGIIFSRLLKRLSKRVLSESVSRDCCGRGLRGRNGRV